MKNAINKFSKVETKGNFSLFLNTPVYKEYQAGDGFVIKNTKTGEILGKSVQLYMHLYDDNFNKLPEIVYDEDCYEIVEETV